VSRSFENGRALPGFLLDYIYSPFVRAAIYVMGYDDESAMIWPPVFGIAVGILVYSAVFAVFFALMTRGNDP
jgi:hypothetical protein